MKRKKMTKFKCQKAHCNFSFQVVKINETSDENSFVSRVLKKVMEGEVILVL